MCITDATVQMATAAPVADNDSAQSSQWVGWDSGCALGERRGLGSDDLAIISIQPVQVLN
jgi:hypothetical protein